MTNGLHDATCMGYGVHGGYVGLHAGFHRCRRPGEASLCFEGADAVGESLDMLYNLYVW